MDKQGPVEHGYRDRNDIELSTLSLVENSFSQGFTSEVCHARQYSAPNYR